jgi:hypothetical protein
MLIPSWAVVPGGINNLWPCTDAHEVCHQSIISMPIRGHVQDHVTRLVLAVSSFNLAQPRCIGCMT